MEEDKIKTFDAKGFRKFVANYIVDCKKILTRLKEVHLKLLGAKLELGIRKVLLVGHMYGPYGCQSLMEKIDVIQRMKECANQ